MLKYICFTFKEFETKYPIFLNDYLGQYEDNSEVFFLNKLEELYSNCVSFTENPTILNLSINTKLKNNEFDLLTKKISANKIIVEYRQNTDGYIRYAEKTLFEKIKENLSTGGYVFTVISEKNISEHLFTIGIQGIDKTQDEYFNLELANKYSNSFKKIISLIKLKIDTLNSDKVTENSKPTNQTETTLYPFLTPHGKNLFEEYLKTSTDFNDISFIFYQLTESKPPEMAKMKHADYIDWLKEKIHFTKEDIYKLEKKQSLNKQSDAQFRIDRFIEIKNRLKEAE